MTAPRPSSPMVFLALFAASGCATVQLNPQVEPETLGKPTVTTQPSGLRLVVGHDLRQTLAAASLIVGVGRAQDPRDRPGLAQLVARLVARAHTRQGPARDLYFDSVGALTGDSVGLDETAFHVFARQELWPELLAAQLDALADPLSAIDETDLRAELRLMRDPATDPRTFDRGIDLLRRELFAPGEPYGAPITTASLDGVTLAEVRAFAVRYYRPPNATLSLDGALPANIDEPVRAAIAARAFPAAHSERQPGFSPAGRPDTAGSKVRRHAAPVDAPELWLGWALPSSYGPEAGQLELLLSSVGYLLNSDLLRSDDRDIVSIRTFIERGASATILACRVALTPTGDPDHAAKVVASLVSESWAEVAGLTSKDLRASNVHLYALHVEQTLADRVATWPFNVHYTLDPRFPLHAMTAVIDSLDARAAYDFVTEYLAPELVRGVFIQPAAANLRTAALAPDAGPLETPRPAPPTTPLVAAWGPVRTIITTRTLSNGLTVIVASNDGFPMATALLAFHGGSATDEPPGALQIVDGTGDFATSDLICGGQAGCGLGRTRRLGWDVSATGFVGERSMVPPIVAHFGQVQNVDWVQWPSDPKATRLREQQRLWELEPRSTSGAALREALYPGTRWGLSPRLARFETITSAAAKAWSDSHRAARNSAIIIVGNVEPEPMMYAIEKELTSWTAGEEAPTPPPQALPPGHPAPAVLVNKTPSAAGTHIHFGCRLPRVTERDALWRDIFAQALGRTLDARLRRGLGIARSVGVAHTPYRGGTSDLTGELHVANDGLPRALEELEAMLSHLGEGQWTGDDAGGRLDLELRSYATQWLLDGAAASSLASRLVSRWNLGWSLDNSVAVASALLKPDAAGLAANARACHDTAVISVAADPSTAVPTPKTSQAGREASQRMASSSAQ